jgi:hypothetical protein
MNKIKEVKEKAYEGKCVYYGNRPYRLEPDMMKGMCMGCDLYSKSCPSRITSLCTQGYILKKIIL